MKKVTIIILLLLAVGTCPVAPAAAGQRREVITGAVVAYYQVSAFTPCFDICSGSFIVSVDKPGRMRGKYIHVIIGYPMGKFPSKLVGRRRTLRFKLTRAELADSTLREFVPIIDSETGKESSSNLPAWRLIPGAESERLPFGEKLPSYLLMGDVSKLLGRV